MNEKYVNQVKLLVKVLNFIAKENCFALKGGTAINLFFNNLPRLSVDIDLTYTGFEIREIAIQNINSALERIGESLKAHGFQANITGKESEKKIICSDNSASIKIEPNYIIRGCIKNPEVMSICKNAQNIFGCAEIRVVSKSELYGGKICAALDRQHPRDLFDIKEFFEHNDFDDELTKGFITMLLSHDKPLHETLNPNIKDQREIFEKQFKGMTDKYFSYKEHLDTLTQLIQTVQENIQPYKTLLYDFVSLKSDLSEFKINNLKKLPAVQWKIRNLNNLKENNPRKFREQYDKLSEYFNQ